MKVVYFNMALSFKKNMGQVGEVLKNVNNYKISAHSGVHTFSSLSPFFLSLNYTDPP